MQTWFKLVYKILHEIDKADRERISQMAPYTTTTKGHPLKLLKKWYCLNLRSNYFSQRVIDQWKGLPINILKRLQKQTKHRAYPGSEFVVANTLAKWKKLEPNEINFSQGFSQKVVSNCLAPWWYWKIQYSKSKIWHNNKVWRNNKSNIGKPKSWSKYTFSQICNFWTP